MRTIERRLRRLEARVPLVVNSEAGWGHRSDLRDTVLHFAKKKGGLDIAQLKAELDELGPHGLWLEMARYHLQAHGFVQSDQESFAETMARALGISTGDLRAQMEQGRLGTALIERFRCTE